ncbi:MAG: amino acid adenylation domain-containing protein, partial [Burkholderiales bacterium]|nr:amino acid adenylation domain-containing protein [Burkholderiales bacterium]
MNFYEQLARLSPERRALLERKLAEKGLDAALPERIPPRADRGPAPLSFAQQRLWFVQQLEPDSTAYNVASVLRLQGPLDIRALARCIDTLVERHETLRTRFAATSGRQPAQIVEAARADRLASIDLRGEADPEVAARERIEHLTRTPFDLTRVPLRAALLQLAADTHLLVLATHHIVSDRWSVMVFLRELTVLYRAYTRGQSSPLAPLPIQYADWASWQREQLTGDALQRLTDYWTTQLAGDLPRLDLPFDRPRPVIAGDAGAQVPIALSPSLSKAVAALAQQHQATLFAVLLTTFDVLLHRYTDSADIVVGSDIANRERVETENLIGLLVNTLVLRTDLGGNPPFEALLSRVRQVVLDALAHQALPFEKLVELLNPERHLDQMMPLFQAKFDLQQATVKPVQLDGLTLTRETADETRTKYELRFNLQDTPDGIRGQVEYRSDLFDRATIERMVGHFEVLLTGIVADPACPIRDLPLLTETERHWLTDGWNDRTARDYPTDGTLHGLFERQAAAMPDAVAVTDGAHSLTYRELDLQASRLAHELIAMGAGREGPVGICMPRSPRLIVGLLAILKAGAAYVPLDPDYPAARLEFIVEDAGIDVLLTDRASTPLSPLLASRPGLRTVTVGDPAGTVAPETNPVRRSGPQHLAYVIYTSGSTGRPKGVAIEHRNAVTMLHWARETYGDADLAGMLAATSICFDLSVFEIFVPLAWGGRVVIAENLLALPRLPATVGVTLINTVPSVLTQLLSIAALPASVRTVNLAGEALPPDLIERLRRIPHVQRVYNLYGPSEDTTYSTVACFDVDRPAAAPLTRVPIGVPIANTQAYVVDATGHLVPVGVAGELLLGGAGLARGYLARPDLTAAGFVPNPFDRRSPRLYRTGDRVRRLPDGTLEFLGRADHQVKIRGFRIETGETETVLRQHPSVREAIVVAQPVRGTDLQLVAHVEMDTDDGNHAAAARLRTFLQQRLPIYLVPTRLHVTDRLPRLPNGKIDRRALSSADDEPVAAATPVAPRNATEQALAAIWRDVLRRDAAAPVGVDDNFFELGGHSLLAIEIVARIEQTLGRTVPLRLLFHAPTIAQLAVEVDRTNASGTSTTTVRGPLRSDPAARHAPFPLTDIQQAYLVGRNAAFELGNIGTHGYREIDVGGLAIDAVEHALRQLIDRHDMLRAIVTPDGQQRILADVPPVRIAVHALDAAADRDAQLQTIRERLSHQVFDPQRWPLFQVEATDLGDGRIRFHLSFDVLIGDAWSFQLLGRELAQLLQGATLAPLEASFRDYVLAEQAFTASAEHQRAVDYWQRRLDDLPPAPELPLTMAPSQIAAPRFVRRGGRLPAADWQRLKDRAQRAGLTPSGIALAVFAETLAGYARRPDFTLNLTLFNRYPLHPDVNRLVGDFTASLLLAVHERGTEPFATRARRLQAQLWDDLEHRAVGGVQVQRDLARRQQRSGGALMPVVFTSTLNQTATPSGPRDWNTDIVYSVSQTSQVYLDHQVSEVDGALHYNWDAIDALFPDGVLDAMVARHAQRLRALANDDAAWRRRRPAHDGDYLPAYNATRSALFDGPCPLLQTLFFRSARIRPDHPAVIAADRTLTYRELAREVRHLTRRLQQAGVAPGTLVAVAMPKGWQQAVATLGILTAGAAYVPIDPALPRARRDELLADAEARIVLRRADCTIDWPVTVESIRIAPLPVADPAVASETDDNADTDPAPVQRATDLAYVIYTSGSTGVPKGVMIDHRGAVNTVLDINHRYGIGADDRIFGLSSLSFDLSVYDLFGTFAAGATLVLPAADQLQQPAHWRERLRSHRVTVWNSVPALMQLLLTATVPADHADALRVVMLSGDWIPLSLPDAIGRAFPDARVISLGGATEASIWSIDYPIEAVDPAWRSIPYGRPLTNQQWYVLDDDLNPCPPWVPGQLYIGG